jgi:hypothetical protein
MTAEQKLALVTGGTGTGLVTGAINDLGGVQLSGVLVSVLDDQNNVIGYDFTDSQGNYTITGLEDGNFVVQASKMSYISEDQNFSFNSGSGNSININFDLEELTLVTIDDPATTSTVPSRLELAANYPNPFNPSTTIRFNVPSTQTLRLVVYNLLGQTVKELVNGQFNAGQYQFEWDGTNSTGQVVSSGVYFYSLEGTQERLVRKMLFKK